MGGFWSVLGQIGEGTAQNVAQKTPLGQAIYSGVNNRYQSPKSQQHGMGPTPLPADDGTAGMDAISGANSAAGMPDLASPGSGQADTMQNTIPDAESMASMSQWNQPQQQSQGGGALGALGSAVGLAKGAIVTHPMIAKIGEHGPEAVVPLTPRAGNKLQPDLLEGRLSNPAIPGVRYQRYKSYNRLGPNAGGQV